MSLDGDSQSANNLKPAWNLEIGNKLWVFRTDSNGNLLWERAIGTQTESHEYLADVIKQNDREYVLLAECGSSGGEMPCGDYNCTNDTAYLMNSYNNYWVLHVTDTVDYTTLQVPVRLLPEERAIFVYPNPANGKVTIEGVEAEEVWVYNALGQLVKRVRNSNEVSLEGLVQGVYLVRIRDKEGGIFMEKVMGR